jgi:hypothetical protein
VRKVGKESLVYYELWHGKFSTVLTN